MIVICEACFTSFNVNDELIKPSGSKVKCSKCHKVFRAYPLVPEDITPPEPTDLSDITPLDETVVRQKAAVDYSLDDPVSSVDFTNITEFDFSELDILLKEEDKDKSEIPFSSLQENRPEIKGQPDEAPEQAFPEILLDESVDGAEGQPVGMNLESEEKFEFAEPEPQDLSLDDFEKSLEMDFSDISLDARSESETIDDQKIEVAETETKSDQEQEDTLISEGTITGFDDVETLDLTEIEGLLEDQEVSESILNEDAESFQRADSVIVPPPASSAETEQLLEMDDHYLTFDELQLDLDDSKSATLQEVKESFQPPLSETAAPRTEPSPQPEPVSREAVSGDKDIPADADIDEDLEDTRPAPKKGISPAILIAIILAVIAAAGYGGYMLLNSMGISIPFISQPAPSKGSDQGNLSIKSFDISSKFVDNNKIGKLFVITGKVKNEYPMAIGSIRISGKIYTKDKVLAKTETVFCGNILSDTDLSNADSATLKQRLQNKSGDNQINQKVLPGAAIPFMIVFTNLPANLEEFTTEVISSVAS
jgi:pilus assembly protein FimV